MKKKVSAALDRYLNDGGRCPINHDSPNSRPKDSQTTDHNSMHFLSRQPSGPPFIHLGIILMVEKGEM
jgi:hypothetical protein